MLVVARLFNQTSGASGGTEPEGSFTTSPIRLLDDTYEWTIGATEGGAGGTPMLLKFQWTTGRFGELTNGPNLAAYGDGNSQTGVDTPQWHEDEPSTTGPGTQWGVRYVADLGPDSLTGSPDGSTTAPTEGDEWLLGATRVFYLLVPRTASINRDNTSTYEIYRASDNKTLARANIRIKLNRDST